MKESTRILALVSSATAPSTDVVTRATETGTQLVAVLRNEQAPKTIPFQLDLPAGAALVSQADGSYVVTAPVTDQVVPDSETDRVSAAVDAILGDAPDDQPVTDAQQTALDAIPAGKTVPETTQQDVATLAAPWAVDANGKSVPTHYEINGTTVNQVVDTTPDTAYPVTADPSVAWWVWTTAKCVADIGLLFLPWVKAGKMLLNAVCSPSEWPCFRTH